MLRFEELCDRHCVTELIDIVRQVGVRAEARAPIWLNEESVGRLIFWTVIRWERTFPLTCIEQLVPDMGSLTSSVDGLLQLAKEAGPAEKSRSVVFDPSIPTSTEALDQFLLIWLERAEEQARALEHGYLGTEHLLLALFESADPVLSTVLHDNGLSHAKFKEAVSNELVDMPHERFYTPELLEQRASTTAWDLTQWDTPAVGVPQRFGMAILMMLVTMYSILFATMKWIDEMYDAPPSVFIVVALLFTGVGLGQMLLFGGKYPRAASIYVGACLFPVELIIAIIYYANSSDGLGTEPLGALCFALIFGIPFGALCGYLAGGLTAGAFLLIEMYFKSADEEEEIEAEVVDEISSTQDTRPE